MFYSNFYLHLLTRFISNYYVALYMVADDGVKKTKFTKVNLKNLISFTE